MEIRRLYSGDGRERRYALSRLASQEVSVFSIEDLQCSRDINIATGLPSFRVKIASGSLEL
jgi:hypothetical protein